MLDSLTTRPQPAPTGDGADVTDLVIRDMVERRAAGTVKYGTSLKTFNGRDALIDAYQEALDMTLYLRQRIAEERGDHEGLSSLAGSLDDVIKKVTLARLRKCGGSRKQTAASLGVGLRTLSMWLSEWGLGRK